MSGVGFWELVLLFLIGLIVLGPERLPRVANQLGVWIGQARRMTRVLKRQLEDELNFEKELNIRPQPVVKSLARKPAQESDDRYSPAHDADSPGTGVREPDSGGDDDFADTDVLEETVDDGTKTAAEVGTTDRNSATNRNT